MTAEAGAVAGRLAVTRSTAVHRWALAGAVLLAVEASVLIAWLASGDAKPVKAAAEAPSAERAWAAVLQVGIVAFALVLGALVVRRCLRDRRVTFDLVLLITWYLVFWRDPDGNLLRTQYIYGPHFVNLGSWAGHMPEWVSPNPQRMPQTLLSGWPGMASWSFVGAVIFSVLAVRFRRRWPARRAAPFLAAGLVLLAIEIPLELAAMRTSFINYPGVIRELSFFAGTRFQLPIYAPVCWVLAMSAMGYLRYRLDDRGLSPVERGADRLPAGWRRDGRRLLAVYAAGMVTYVVCWTIPLNLAAPFIDPYPEDYPVHMNPGICGAGTEVPCPGPGVSIIDPQRS